MALTYTNADRSLRATLTYNDEWEEWIVRFYRDGALQKGADYHTDCRDDAEGTADHFVTNG